MPVADLQQPSHFLVHHERGGPFRTEHGERRQQQGFTEYFRVKDGQVEDTQYAMVSQGEVGSPEEGYYGGGGYAYGDVQRRTTYYGPNAPTTPFFTGQSNGMRSGFAYGGGVEYAVPTDSFFNRFD